MQNKFWIKKVNPKLIIIPSDFMPFVRIVFFIVESGKLNVGTFLKRKNNI